LPSPGATAEAHPRWLSGLATAAAVAFGVGLIFTVHQRDAARQENDELRRQHDALEVRARAIDQEREALQRRLAWEASVRDLVAQPEARTTPLAGQGPAVGAKGRVVWNPTTREAVLVVSGLDPAPPGKAYEIWVIADGAPVPAGVFQVEPDGRAAFRLPAVEQTARAKTFIVTLEPVAGSPAPGGPAILLGPVS
jgi:anti-sigma-K factor RskA